MQRVWWYAPALGFAALALSGCSLIVGGSGTFDVEGDTYKASRVSCEKREGGLALTLDSGAASAKVGVTDEPQPKVLAVTMGSKNQTSMMMRAQDNIGRAVVTRTNKTFVVNGNLQRVSRDGQPGGGAEDFALTVTCNSIG